MYINSGGNVVCVCTAVTSPNYKEEVGERGCELTVVLAKCRESIPEGHQTVNIDLLFFDNLAIPAMKIKVGQSLIVYGRETSQEIYLWGKHKLERKVIVDAWDFRKIDPGGYLEQLKARREIAVRNREFREMFAEFLTEAKPSIIKWVMDYSKELREKNSKKKDGGDQ